MLCLVRQPNAVILEVEVNPKAKGKQCLDKVCEMLGIIERDYMGLQYFGPHGEKLWLNMRNQLRRQLVGPPPYRLNLRVKFFVPPHLILQDITRHHFYLDVRQDFLEGHIRTNTKQLCRLVALIIQAEYGDFDNSNRSNIIVAYHKWFPPSYCKADSSKPPTLRVRWRSGGSENPSESDQAEGQCEEPRVSIETNRTVMASVYQEIMKEHVKLSGTKSLTAKTIFLKETSELEDFGMEQYFVKNCHGEMYRVGVGPVGVVIHDMNLTLIHNIPYASIQLATNAGRCFFLNYINDAGKTEALDYKLENCQAASAVYRAVTEKHAFYSCETVKNAVTSQFIRDLKGTIASLFNENTALGKNYVFDIQRTCREVYDHTRRIIYQMESEVCKKSDDNSECVHKSEMTDSNSSCKCPANECKNIQEQLAYFQDSMLCRICMDSDVSTVFFPCRHVVCCSSCAPLCKDCPLCRRSVEDTQHVYLPFVSHQPVTYTQSI